MKSLYDKDGTSAKIPVTIVAWDRCKYFVAIDLDGNPFEDKTWKFDLKRSNKIFTLPTYCVRYEGEDDEVVFDVEERHTNKRASKELKNIRKGEVKYSVTLADQTGIEFSRLEKALNFCKSNSSADFLSYQRSKKSSYHSFPLLSKEEGEWNYFSQKGTSVSEKRLKYIAVR